MDEDNENPEDIKNLLSLKKQSLTEEDAKLMNMTSEEKLAAELDERKKELQQKITEKDNYDKKWFFKTEDMTDKLKEEVQQLEKNVQKLKTEIQDRKSTEEKIKNLRDGIQKDEKKLSEIYKNDRSPGKHWRLIDDKESIFDEKTRRLYFDKLYDLNISEILSKWREKKGVEHGAKSKTTNYINLLLIGGSGAGKSSLLNTVKTAVRNNDELAYGSADHKQSMSSVTEKLILVPLRKRDWEVLPIQMFDTMGICKTFGHREIEMVAQGHLRSNKKIASEGQMKQDGYRENPGLVHQMHGVIYVIKADTCMQKTEEKDFLIKEINAVRTTLAKENLPQFVIVTAIDTIGVPNDDVGSMLRYRCVENVCKRVSNDTQIPEKYIFPTSNYYKEVIPSPVKDAIALFNLWKILNYTIDHLMNLEGRSDVPDDFYEKDN